MMSLNLLSCTNVVYLQFAGTVSNMQVDMVLAFPFANNSECYGGMHSECVMCNVSIFPGILFYVLYVKNIN